MAAGDASTRSSVRVLDAVMSAVSARSSGDVQGTPSMEASLRSSNCCSSPIRSVATCRGVIPFRAARAAPAPAASPVTAQVAITRVVPKATWLAEMSRPAISRFRVFREYSERKGRGRRRT